MQVSFEWCIALPSLILWWRWLEQHTYQLTIYFVASADMNTAERKIQLSWTLLFQKVCIFLSIDSLKMCAAHSSTTKTLTRNEKVWNPNVVSTRHPLLTHYNNQEVKQTSNCCCQLIYVVKWITGYKDHLCFNMGINDTIVEKWNRSLRCSLELNIQYFVFQPVLL